MRKVIVILSLLLLLFIPGGRGMAAASWGFYMPSNILELKSNIISNDTFSFYATLVRFDNKQLFKLFKDINTDSSNLLMDRYIHITGPKLDTTIISLKAEKEVGSNLRISGSFNIGDISLPKEPITSLGFSMSYLTGPGTKFVLNYEQSEENKNIGVKIYIEF